MDKPDVWDQINKRILVIRDDSKHKYLQNTKTNIEYITYNNCK